MFDATHRVSRRVVLVGGVIALLVAIVVGGTRPEPVLLGSNGVRPNAFVAVLPGGKTLCQGGWPLPRGTGRLGMTIGTYGHASRPVRARVRDARGTLVAAGGLGDGWQQGVVLLPLDRPVSRDLAGARLCLSNGGTHAIALAGSPSDGRRAARIGRRRAAGPVSTFYVSGRPESDFARAGSIAAAMQGPGLWGRTAPWAAVAFALLALWSVVRTLW